MLDFLTETGRGRPATPADRIRVAILDTGVDVTHDELRGPWLKGQIIYENFVGAASGVPRDDNGHGTHVTSILNYIAPNVDIYIARVSPDGLKWKATEVEEVSDSFSSELASLLSSCS